MKVLLLASIFAASVPEVTPRPELAGQARLVDATITKVVVYSDRAKIIRRAAFENRAKIVMVRFPDLPGAVLQDTVRVTARWAKILRVEVTAVKRERVSIDQVDDLLRKLDQLVEKIALLDKKVEVYRLELKLLNSVKPAMPLPEDKRADMPVTPLLPSAWSGVLDFLDQASEKVDEKIHALVEQRLNLAKELKSLQDEAARRSIGGYSNKKLQVAALLKPMKKANTVTLDLEYFIAGAYWLPAYDLRYSSRTSQVTMASLGMVTQSTGEDWKDVELLLSTAIPGQEIEFPKLLTWTLGEKKEFVPHSKPRSQRSESTLARPAAGPPPVPTIRSSYNQEIQESLARLRYLSTFDPFNPSQVASRAWSREGHLRLSAAGPAVPTGDTEQLTTGLPAVVPRSAPAKAKRPTPMMPAPPPRAPASRGFDEETLTAEITSNSKQVESTGGTTTSLPLFDGQYYEPPTFSNPDLPAIVAGGLDFIYRVPTRASVASDGKSVQVPLSTAAYEARESYEATPCIDKTAYLKVTVKNQARNPILKGKANLFMDGDYVGRADIRTTGPGGELSLPLGADKDIKLARKVVTRTKTKGVFSKTDITAYHVTIEVGNYKAIPVMIVVHDQVPRSNNEDIHIKFKRASPGQTSGPDEKDGVISWRLNIPAGQTRKIDFVYTIERPENWQLYQ